MTELEILTAIKNNGDSIGYTELLNIGLTSQNGDVLTDSDLIEILIHQDVLSGNPNAFGRITFGKYGRLRLQQLQQLKQKSDEDAAKAAKEKRIQHRHDWAIAIFSTLGGALLSQPLWSALNFLWEHILFLLGGH